MVLTLTAPFCLHVDQKSKILISTSCLVFFFLVFHKDQICGYYTFEFFLFEILPPEL